MAFDSERNFILEIVFSVLLFYFEIFLYNFIFKIKTAKTSNNPLELKEGFKDIDLEKMNKINFSNLDKIIGFLDDVVLNVNTESSDLLHKNYSYLHYIIYLIENGREKEAENVDFSRYCPTCIKFKQPKTKHCSKCNKCIEEFNHHSIFFNKCIGGSNHFFWFSLLTLQEFILFIYIYLQYSSTAIYLKSYFFLYAFETAYQKFILSGLCVFLAYVLFSICFFYNSIFFCIELYGVFQNLTFNEIFHRQRYRYLFDEYVDKKGKSFTYFSNKTSKGVSNNLKNYFGKKI